MEEEENNHLIEINPQEISISMDQLTTEFNILNLTLQYIPFKVISPNPMIYQIEPSQGELDPCDSKDIKITAKISSAMNFNCFERDNIITILVHENCQDQWENININDIQKHQIKLNILRPNMQINQIKDNAIIAQIVNKQLFTDDEKKIIIDFIMGQYGQTKDYSISNTLMIFRYNIKISGSINIIQYPNSEKYFILRIFSPYLTVNTQPKYPQEPMSPQNLRKKVEPQIQQIQVTENLFKSTPSNKKEQKKLKKRNSATNLSTSTVKLEVQSTQQTIQSDIFLSPQPPLHIENIQSTSNSDQQLYEDLLHGQNAIKIEQNIVPEFTTTAQQPQQNIEIKIAPQINNLNSRKYGTEMVTKKEVEEFYNKPKNKTIIKKGVINLAPIQFEQNMKKSYQETSEVNQNFNDKDLIYTNTNNNNNPPKFKKITGFNTYSKIKLVLLFKDHSYLITVSDTNIITVWSLHLNSEEGKLRDHYELKKVKLQSIFQWIDINEKKFATISSDQLIRIFSIEEMRLKYIMKIDDYSEITCITFLPDKEQVCIAGTPIKEFSIFGSKYPKYRFIRLFASDNLKEVLSHKMQVQEGQILNPIEYTDNENQKHARLNNMLVVNKAYKNKEGGEIICLMIDMNNKLTVILTLNYEQIQIYSVKSLHYLPTLGSFVVVEKNSPKSYTQNKIFIVNVKQLETEEGLKNGIVCKYFEESSVLDDEIFVLSKEQFVLKVKGDIVHLIDLKSGQQFNLQITQQMGDNPKNIVQAGKIIRIDGENLQILELLN